MNLQPDSRLVAAKAQINNDISNLIAAGRNVSANRYEIANLFNTSVAVNACTNFWADALSGVMWDVMQHGKPVPKDDPFQVLMDNTSDIFRRMELSRHTWGNVLLKKERTMLGQPYALQWVNPMLYQLDVSAQGLDGFRVYAGRYNDTESGYIDIADAVYTHGLDLFNDFDGVSGAEVAFTQASASQELAQTALAVFRNSIFLGGIFQPTADELDMGTSDEKEGAVKRLTDALRRVFQGGANAGKTLVNGRRWEYIKLQQEFDKIQMSENEQALLSTICLAFGVPVEFLTTGQTTYAELEGKINLWYQLRLNPVIRRYADVFTEQVGVEFGDGYTLEPDLSNLVIADSPSDQTALMQQRLDSITIDLYTAQKELGNDTPDERLKGLYMVAGIPVPADKLGDIWQSQFPVYGSHESLTVNETEQTATLPIATENGSQRIDDGIFAELKNWRRITAKKGLDHTFATSVIPPDTVTFIQWMIKSDIEDSNTIFDSAEASLRGNLDSEDWNVLRYEAVQRASSTKAIDATRARFVRTMTPIFQALADGDFAQRRATTLIHAEIQRFARMAYLDGLISGGIPDATITKDEQAAIAPLVTKQKQFATDMIKAVLRGDRQIRNARHFATTWYNGSVYPFFVEGQANGRDNPNEIWVMDASKENCASCERLNGQIHRRSTWNKRGLFPNSNKLICGAGNNCGCERKVTAEKARGRFLPASFLVNVEAKAVDGAGYIYVNLADNDFVTRYANHAKSLIKNEDDIFEWVSPTQYHITLAYAPSIPTPVLKSLAHHFKFESFRVDVQGFDMFQTPDGQVLYVRVDKNPALMTLQRQAHDLLRNAGYVVSEHSNPETYTPHITIAYLDDETVFMQDDMLPDGNPPRVTDVRFAVDDYETVASVTGYEIKTANTEGV